MACELDLNGSGAASLEVFWETMFEDSSRGKHEGFAYGFAFLADHGGGGDGGGRGVASAR